VMANTAKHTIADVRFALGNLSPASWVRGTQ
jgi:hypothetical protein